MTLSLDQGAALALGSLVHVHWLRSHMAHAIADCVAPEGTFVAERTTTSGLEIVSRCLEADEFTGDHGKDRVE